MNGWNDYYQELNRDKGWSFSQINGTKMEEGVVTRPTDTVLYGEKEISSRHFYMDFLESSAGNDFEDQVKDIPIVVAAVNTLLVLNVLGLVMSGLISKP